MTDNVEITGNTMAFPKDETTPWGTRRHPCLLAG
jgi:hypothetical protein